MGHLFFTFFATFCTVVTTNSSRLYKFLPSMLLGAIQVLRNARGCGGCLTQRYVALQGGGGGVGNACIYFTR